MPNPGGMPPTGSPGRGGIPGFTQPKSGSTSDDDDRAMKRTEFVILFIWKEPTESDRLRNLKSSGQGGAAAAPAGAGSTASPKSTRPKRKKSDDAQNKKSDDAQNKKSDDAKKDAKK